jgi:GNAT superfamily N-acetyltransferase
VIAFAQALTDGSIQAYLSRLLVAPGSRRQGIAGRLLREVIERSGAVGLGVLVGDGAEAFYESLPGRAYTGPPDPGHVLTGRQCTTVVLRGFVCP